MQSRAGRAITAADRTSSSSTHRRRRRSIPRPARASLITAERNCLVWSTTTRRSNSTAKACFTRPVRRSRRTRTPRDCCRIRSCSRARSTATKSDRANARRTSASVRAAVTVKQCLTTTETNPARAAKRRETRANAASSAWAASRAPEAPCAGAWPTRTTSAWPSRAPVRAGTNDAAPCAAAGWPSACSRWSCPASAFTPCSRLATRAASPATAAGADTRWFRNSGTTSAILPGDASRSGLFALWPFGPPLARRRPLQYS